MCRLTSKLDGVMMIIVYDILILLLCLILLLFVMIIDERLAYILLFG
jgi:hypothetical protein